MSVSLSPPISNSGNYVYGGITNPVDSTDTTAAAIMAQVSKEVSFLFPVLSCSRAEYTDAVKTPSLGIRMNNYPWTAVS